MKKIAIIAAIIGVLGLATQSFALEEKPLYDNATLLDNTTVQNPQPQTPPRHMRISERFGRSMSNIIFSPLELPAQIYIRAKYQEDQSFNPFAAAGGLIEGIPMGALVYFPWRLSAGLVDLFTIWSPRCDKCLIEPEYLSFSPVMLDNSSMLLDKNPQAVKKCKDCK
jgi:hypothetical protein